MYFDVWDDLNWTYQIFNTKFENRSCVAKAKHIYANRSKWMVNKRRGLLTYNSTASAIKCKIKEMQEAMKFIEGISNKTPAKSKWKKKQQAHTNTHHLLCLPWVENGRNMRKKKNSVCVELMKLLARTLINMILNVWKRKNHSVSCYINCVYYVSRPMDDDVMKYKRHAIALEYIESRFNHEPFQFY